LEWTVVDPMILLVGAGGALVGASIGFVIRKLRSRKAKAKDGTAWAPREEGAGDDLRELRKSVWLLQNESKNLSTFLMLLPDFAREINSKPDKRRVAPLLMNMVDQIFDPQQILVFYTAQKNDGLILVDFKGLDAGFNKSRVIPFGEGRVGWVASNQISMDEADFAQKAQFMRESFDPAIHPNFKVDLAVPMAHKEDLLGVISVGGLSRRVKNEKTMLRMIADLGSVALNNAVLFHRMEQVVSSDGLTGLCSKRFFLSSLAEQILKAESTHEEFSVFLFDIDHFKNYNDRNGHMVGDEGLKQTGKVIRQTIREDDLPARYGGEEFIILLPNTPKSGAMVTAEKVRAAIQNHVYPKEENQPGGDLTISGGVASYPYDGKTSAELISAADLALYKAKRSGRNRIQAYEPMYLSDAEENVAEAIPVTSQP